MLFQEEHQSISAAWSAQPDSSFCSCWSLQYDAVCECNLLNCIFHWLWMAGRAGMWNAFWSCESMSLALADIDGGWTTRVALAIGLHCRGPDERLCRVARVSAILKFPGWIFATSSAAAIAVCWQLLFLLMQTSLSIQKLKTQRIHCNQSNQFHHQLVTSFPLRLVFLSHSFFFLLSADGAQKRQIVLANTALVPWC